MDSQGLRASIIASLIASALFLAFIQPIMVFAWNKVFASGIAFVEMYTNSIYKNAALGQRDWAAALVLMMIIGLSFVLFVTMGLTAVSPAALGPNRPKSQPNNLVRSLLSTRLGRTGICLLAFSGLWAGGSLMISVFYDLQLNTGFTQRLNILAPVITEDDEEKLRAMWSAMKSRSDYEKVNSTLEATAKAHGVLLPPPLLK